jgi:hypothetical protein
MLINNDFVYLPIPKNASTSIMYSLLQWRIKFDSGNEEINKQMIEEISKTEFTHYHTTYDYLINKFPNKKAVGIRRPSVDRFFSSLKYMIQECRRNNVELKYNFEKLKESEVIEIFTKIFYDLPYSKDRPIVFENELKQYNNQINNIIKENITTDYSNFDYNLVNNFHSQYYWGLNKCDTIIDMSELHKFTDMIKNIKPNFNLIKMNDTDDMKLNIERSDKIIEFVDKVIDYKWLNENTNTIYTT